MPASAPRSSLPRSHLLLRGLPRSIPPVPPAPGSPARGASAPAAAPLVVVRVVGAFAVVDRGELHARLGVDLAHLLPEVVDEGERIDSLPEVPVRNVGPKL